MKKLIIMTAVAASAMFAHAAYQVYEVNFTGKTTKYGDTRTTSCGESYAYRNGTTVTIKGILAGCGCAESIANGTCDGRVIAFWNETTKTPLYYSVDDGFTHRIGKKGESIEQFQAIHLVDSNSTWECTIFAAGFGAYKANATDAELDQMKVSSGFFGGYMSAPLTKVQCTACSTSGGELTQSLGICGCACDTIEETEYVPYGGKYMIAPSNKKAKACEKKGISAKNLGIPSYAVIEN